MWRNLSPWIKTSPVRSLLGLEIAFKYTGQPVTCYCCGSTEDLVKDCPKQRQPRPARAAAGEEADREPPTPHTSSEESTDSMDAEPSQADTVTLTPFTEPTPASPPPSYATVSQNLFSNSGDASRKWALPSPAKEDKPATKKATVTSAPESPFMRHFMLALKKQGKHHANLMKAISGPDFYNYRALFLQYSFGNYADQDL